MEIIIQKLEEFSSSFLYKGILAYSYYAILKLIKNME